MIGLFRYILFYTFILLAVGIGVIDADADNYGDIDGDGVISADDAKFVLHYLANKIELTLEQKKLADVNGDGKLNTYDAGLILKRSSVPTFVFPVDGGSEVTGAIVSEINPIDVSVPNAEGAAGSEVIIPIITGYVPGAPELEVLAIDITLDYDPDILTAIDVIKDGTLTSEWQYIEYDVISGRIYITMIGYPELNGQGNLIKIKFKVSDEANIGNTSVLNFSDFQYNSGEVPVNLTDGEFEVILPSSYVQISSPNGGEKIMGGGTYNITWTTGGSGIHHVHLLYSINSGIDYQDIVKNTENDGSYQWNPVPSVNSSVVRVKAYAENSSNLVIMSDISNGFFTIDSTKPVTNYNLTGTEGQNGWWTSNVTVNLTATDNLSGVKEVKYKINDGSWTTYSTPFAVTGSTVYYYAEDNAGNKEGEKSVEIKIDKTAPDIPVVDDDGDCTADSNRLHASWTASVDLESGVVEYQYAIGETPGETDVVNWTSVGTSTQVTKTGLNLVSGQTYYFSVKAKNEAGLWSDVGESDGITYSKPEIGVTPTKLNFYALTGWPDPSPKILNITNIGCGTLNWSIIQSMDWLSCEPSSGQCTTETDEVTISVDVTNVPQGTHNAILTISATGAINTPQYIPVTLTVSDTPTVTLFLPNGGEKIKGGGSYNITWDSTKMGIHHIHLLYTTDGSVYQDIVANTADDNSYSWSPIPSLNSGNVKVKIVAEDAANTEKASDTSDNSFIIDSTNPVTNHNLTGTQGQNGWWASDVTVNLTSTDNLSGVKEVQYKINAGSWITYTSPFIVTGSTVYYYAEDNVGNKELDKSLEVKIDKTAPSASLVTDDGDCTPDGTKLHASWTASVDLESGIAEYQYAIGKVPGGTDVVNWTSVGTDTQVIKTGLNLISGQFYYFSVKARNNAGLWSEPGESNGIVYNQPGIGAEPSSLTFYALTGGDDPSPKVLSITNTGCGTINWTVSKDKNWVSCTPPSGQCAGETDEVTVSVDISSLGTGTHNATITISASEAGNSPINIPVTLNLSTTHSVKVISPNSGEKIKGGSSYNITWESTGGAHHIHLLYSTDGGSIYQNIVASTEDDGIYSWNVPFLSSTTAKVKVIAENSGNGALASDVSDNSFTIDGTPPITTIALAGIQVEVDLWVSDVMVTLSATDDLSGVKQTFYKINDGVWNVYSGPFVVTGSIVYYRSEDEPGNIEAVKSLEININKFYQPPGVYKRELHLYPGRNLMSVCADIGYTHLPSVLNQIAGKYNAVWAYDSVSKLWKRHIPGSPFNTLDTIEPGKGYCIDMIDGAVITFIGRKVASPAIQLYQGWNFVGYNSVDQKSRSVALSSILGKYLYISTCVRSTDTYTWYKHLVYAPNVLNNLFTFYPNYAYWINVSQNCIWNVAE